MIIYNLLLFYFNFNWQRNFPRQLNREWDSFFKSARHNCHNWVIKNHLKLSNINRCSFYLSNVTYLLYGSIFLFCFLQVTITNFCKRQIRSRTSPRFKAPTWTRRGLGDGTTKIFFEHWSSLTESLPSSFKTISANILTVGTRTIQN